MSTNGDGGGEETSDGGSDGGTMVNIQQDSYDNPNVNYPGWEDRVSEDPFGDDGGDGGTGETGGDDGGGDVGDTDGGASVPSEQDSFDDPNVNYPDWQDETSGGGGQQDGAESPTDGDQADGTDTVADGETDIGGGDTQQPTGAVPESQQSFDSPTVNYQGWQDTAPETGRFDQQATGVESGATSSDLAGTRFVGDPDEAVQQAQDYESQVVDRTDADPEDVSVTLAERYDDQLLFRPEFSEAYRREQAAEGIEGVSPSDIRLSDGQASLTPAARQERQADARTEVTQRLESQAEQQVGRDLSPGEDFTVTQEGDQYQLNWTDEFLQEQGERGVEANVGRDLLGGLAGIGAGPAVGEAVSETVPTEVARGASPIEAGEDFTVEVGAGGVGGSPFGSGGETPEPDDRDVSVELTEQFREERQQAADAGDGAGGGPLDFITGPPGSLEQDLRYAASDPVGAATGPPGTLEQEAGTAYYGALGMAATGGGDPLNVVGGAPGSIESGVGDVAYGVRDASAGAVETVGPPAGDILGDVVEFGSRGMAISDPQAWQAAPEATQDAYEGYIPSARDVLRPPEQEVTETTIAERVGEGGGRAAVEATVGLPAAAVGTGGLAADAAEFTAGEIEEEGVVEGTGSSVVAGGEFAYEAGETIAREAAENPAYFSGMVVGGAVGGAAATPFRFSRLDVPTRDGGTTAVRGARIREPAIVRPLTGRQRGRTIAGLRGLRPTLGAPSLRDVDVDYAGLGTTGTATAEAMSSFEADIFRSTAADIGGEGRTRFSEAEDIQRQATRQSRADFQFETAEGALAEARAVPESAVPDVADALRDLDATVFGSVATRARVEGFRQPRDIDITVPDEGAARTRLSEALEGEEATVGDVFDMKTEADAPGRAFGGEEIKYGFESMEPDTIDGIRFNPAEEELIRKAGASAFIRGPGAAGTPDIDVGPEPRRPGRTDVRQKDVEDTAAIARELVGEGEAAEFEAAFGLAPESAAGGGLLSSLGQAAGDIEAPGVTRGLFTDGGRTDIDPQRQRAPEPDVSDETPGQQPSTIGELFADDRAQLGAGRRRAQPETPTDVETTDTVRETAETAMDPVDDTPSPLGSQRGAETPLTTGGIGTAGGGPFTTSPSPPGAGAGADSQMFAPTATGMQAEETQAGLGSPSGSPLATQFDTPVPGPTADQTDDQVTTGTATPTGIGVPTVGADSPGEDAGQTGSPAAGGIPGAGAASPGDDPGAGGIPSPIGAPGGIGTPSPPPSPPSGGLPGFGIPTQPYLTGGGGDEPATRTVRPESGADDDEIEDYRPEAPTGQEFVNPVATGQQFIFGGALSDGGSNNGGGQQDTDGQNDVFSLFMG